MRDECQSELPIIYRATAHRIIADKLNKQLVYERVMNLLADRATRDGHFFFGDGQNVLN